MATNPVEGYEPPHGNSIAWRYISLDKFIDLLVHSRLHFANHARMTDQLEGTIPRKNLDTRRKELEKQGLSGRELEEAMVGYQYPIHAFKDASQINCWSVLRHESYALWKIYLNPSPSGVAIRSTVGRIRKAIKDGEDDYPDTVHIGRVEYKDFIEEPITRFDVLLTKSPFYEFEHELRLCILEFARSEGGEKRPYNVSAGRTVRVDLDVLVERILLSPFVAPWFEGSFRELVSHLRPSLADRVGLSAIRDS